MATNHTQNYALNLWEPADKFVREEFNENSNKIDAALKALDTAKGNCRIVTGTYTGNGQYGQDSPTVFHFDGNPVLVFIFTDSCAAFPMTGGTFYLFLDSGSNKYGRAAWGNKTLSIYSKDSASYQMNISGTQYLYVALIAN